VSCLRYLFVYLYLSACVCLFCFISYACNKIAAYCSYCYSVHNLFSHNISRRGLVKIQPFLL
jgi:hypothetical protein